MKKIYRKYKIQLDYLKIFVLTVNPLNQFVHFMPHMCILCRICAFCDTLIDKHGTYWYNSINKNSIKLQRFKWLIELK